MLLNHGHQRIGYLSSNHGIEDDDMRREGWSKALQEQGIIAPDSWIGSGSPDMQGGEAAMVELLGRNLGLTAVFAYNDSMAAGADDAEGQRHCRAAASVADWALMIFLFPVTPILSSPPCAIR
ncbi:Mgl repressor and galactose ultrainduction factor GalS [Klebsiella pneumoniae]|uniref:Mgl repressor and galactose ultrainduction factor GalS n=1 Tax=Klebsiella pneumoniae TaxID=573 RepID=A0A378G0H6_KLEPN|nr:Mgl repressor and galactose ultrainduction factor GalS [Klebsiella pneumoniae]